MTSRVITGDCRAVLATLDAGSVQCCVTSPPYFGLRDYGTATWDGGDAGCDHKQSNYDRSGGFGPNDKTARLTPYRHTCGKCGARRIDAQIGLEQSPDAYVAEMVAVFREVRRVLRDDGTVWLNIGDSYAAAGFNRNGSGNSAIGGGPDGLCKQRDVSVKRDIPQGYKPKDLLGIPWMVAFALRADGWWLRSDIIWAKPNPMPESVTSRPTSAHEHVFLLSKRASYYYDSVAVAEAQEGDGRKRGCVHSVARSEGSGRQDGGREWQDTGTRNLRNVWSIATSPTPFAHFAVMPADLAERCIKAGTRPGDTVLDPFAGAGTTLLCADRLGRNGIGIELNPAYAVMARNRVRADCPLFADVAD